MRDDVRAFPDLSELRSFSFGRQEPEWPVFSPLRSPADLRPPARGAWWPVRSVSTPLSGAWPPGVAGIGRARSPALRIPGLDCAGWRAPGRRRLRHRSRRVRQEGAGPLRAGSAGSGAGRRRAQGGEHVREQLLQRVAGRERDPDPADGDGDACGDLQQPGADGVGAGAGQRRALQPDLAQEGEQDAGARRRRSAAAGWPASSRSRCGRRTATAAVP